MEADITQARVRAEEAEADGLLLVQPAVVRPEEMAAIRVED